MQLLRWISIRSSRKVRKQFGHLTITLLVKASDTIALYLFMLFTDFSEEISVGRTGTCFLSLGNFCNSRSSHIFVHDFRCISSEAVPNSRPLHSNYHIWHISALGLRLFSTFPL